MLDDSSDVTVISANLFELLHRVCININAERVNSSKRYFIAAIGTYVFFVVFKSNLRTRRRLNMIFVRIAPQGLLVLHDVTVIS